MKVRHHLCTHVTGISLHSLVTMYGQKLGGCHWAVEILEDNAPEATVWEAIDEGVGEKPFTKWITTYTPIKTWEFDITDPAMQARIRARLKAIDKTPYSMGQIYLIAIGTVFRAADMLLGKMVWNGKLKAICAEVGAVVAEEQGHVFTESLDLVDLKDMYAAVEALKKAWMEKGLPCR